MTFIFQANGKNSTSAVFRLALVRGNEKFCRECAIFSLIYEGLILEFDKKVKKLKTIKLAFAVCRITSCLMSLLSLLFPQQIPLQ